MKRLLSLLLLLLCAAPAWCATDWHNPLAGNQAFVSGRAWNTENNKNYNRIPDRFKDLLPRSVWNLSHSSAGLSVRFHTTSRNITVRYVCSDNAFGKYRNMAPLNHTGVDLYAMDAEGRQHWVGNHLNYNFSQKPGDTITIRYAGIECPNFANRGMEYTLYLPTYNTVNYLSIGTDSGSAFGFVMESQERPIVVYGSSIVQGASASRPGLIWPTIVERELGYPVINMGFSGSALMEASVFDMLSEINARVFIIDPIPNSYGLGEEITKRAIEGVHRLRQKSEAPILIAANYNLSDSMLHPSLYKKYTEGSKKLKEAYDRLVQEGVKNLYFMPTSDYHFTEDCMIEGCHPNDLGMMAYAKAYERKLREILREDTPDKRYPPVRQRRDGCYEWIDRHNAVLELNRTTHPDILMIGNSITHFWGGLPQGLDNGKTSWAKLFKGRRVVNMGFGWDRIENVYWRIFHGELENCSPKHICLLIGINNSSEPSEDVAAGVCRLARLIRQRQPRARLHVIKIYPARGREEWVEKTNRLISEQLTIDDHTDLVDLTECLALHDGSGKVNEAMFREGLHPNEKGYAELARKLKKVLK